MSEPLTFGELQVFIDAAAKVPELEYVHALLVELRTNSNHREVLLRLRDHMTGAPAAVQMLMFETAYALPDNLGVKFAAWLTAEVEHGPELILN